MAVFVNVPSILTVAEISQYLSQQSIDYNINRGGGDVNVFYPRLLYLVRCGVQWRYDVEPTDESLNDTAQYLYALCGRFINQATTISEGEACSVPVIISQPASQSVVEGEDVTLSVIAYSLAEMTYQWYKDGVAIGGATESILELENIASGDYADYYVVITTPCGTATSDTAVLSNDTPVEEPTIYYGTNLTGVLPTEGEILAGSSFQADPLDDVSINWGAPGSPVWYWLAIPNDGAAAQKNKWYESPLNQGSMSGPTDLFDVYTLVSVSGDSYCVWITEYATAFVNNDYVFSKV